ncbi:hypothetical protein HK407_05g10220 [Ordospora pajunii]|uniref:uncharacterized protein n=1 Tax=Ordospora pajunii TaxID=3039483 RepID=UPI00295285F6|nr:uncharacterized protein HK407_05g10220 [Ordospora pajunii]KAH9411355.1 hypothetical protein HK407_05g10220 [Ordospora pajunii]
MPTKIATYTSSMKIPSTLFIEGVLLQNTQVKLSYIHVQFIDNLHSAQLDQFSDILALDGAHIPVHSIEEISLSYHKSIVWSKNIIEAVVSFINHMQGTLSTNYIVLCTNQGMELKERSCDAIHTKSPFTPPHTLQHLSDFNSSHYLHSRFISLHRQKKKPIETIFTRLNKASQKHCSID